MNCNDHENEYDVSLYFLGDSWSVQVRSNKWAIVSLFNVAYIKKMLTRNVTRWQCQKIQCRHKNTLPNLKQQLESYHVIHHSLAIQHCLSSDLKKKILKKNSLKRIPFQMLRKQAVSFASEVLWRHLFHPDMGSDTSPSWKQNKMINLIARRNVSCLLGLRHK